MNRVLIVTSNKRRHESQMFVGGFTNWDTLNRGIMPKLRWEKIGDNCWRDTPDEHYTVYETTLD